jgi:hypothetical protein
VIRVIREICVHPPAPLNFTLLNHIFCFRLSGALRIRASIVNLLQIIALHIYPAYNAFNWGVPFSKHLSKKGYNDAGIIIHTKEVFFNREGKKKPENPFFKANPACFASKESCLFIFLCLRALVAGLFPDVQD